MVDTGMGRLGFDPNSPDSVSTLESLVDLERCGGPVEFYGLCTHMAEACEQSDYTMEQMEKFKVRQKGRGWGTAKIEAPPCFLRRGGWQLGGQGLL